MVTDLSNKDDNEQETSDMQFEDFALKSNVLAFASRSKTKAKPRRCTSACPSTRTIPVGERSWTDIEPETYSSIASVRITPHTSISHYESTVSIYKEFAYR